jgi:hypothetical protein
VQHERKVWAAGLVGQRSERAYRSAGEHRVVLVEGKRRAAVLPRVHVGPSSPEMLPWAGPVSRSPARLLFNDLNAGFCVLLRCSAIVVVRPHRGGRNIGRVAGPLRYAIAVIVLAAVVGCGAELTDDERLDVSEAEVALTRHVIELLEDRTGNITRAAAERSIDRLIEIYRAKADADYDGRTVRQVLIDRASELEAYEPLWTAQLDRAVRGDP